MATRFKILSDFDGVWTETNQEGRALYRQLIEWCTELLGDRPTVEADIAAFLREVREDPGSYGWAPDGRISAFADEDPLCEMAGLGDMLGRAESGTALRYRQAIESRWDSVPAFSQEAFVAAMTRFRAENPPSIAADAREQLRAVTDRGAEVVVVSNSEPAKLLAWFSAAGIDASEEPGHELRICGSAGKQVLGDDDDSLTIGDRRVFVDRPRYRATIERERPDLVIGDIFSLDLSLPHRMRNEGHPAAPDTLVLRRHPHSPTWITHDRAAGAIDHMVERFGDLAALVDPSVES